MLTLNVFNYLQFGQSAMMVASWEGHLGIVEALISAEADTNLQDGVIGIFNIPLPEIRASVFDYNCRIL